MRDWSSRFAKRAIRITASEIRELLKLLARPGIISFAGGIPDPRLFPREIIAEAYARILGEPSTASTALQYGISEGYPPLREWLAGYMAGLGVACGPEQILITNGSQQALDFLAKLFLDPGDRVLAARPTYLGALQAFSAYEADYGMLPEAGGASERSAKLAYLMPDYANPSGRTLTLEEREAVLATATALDLPVIEDAAYEQLYYDREPLPPLLALGSTAAGLDGGRVIYCGTFSKTVVPGLRIGWIVAPRPVIEKLVLIKQAGDLHTSGLNQMAMLAVAKEIVPGHAGEIRAAYRERRDAMLAALERHMPAGVTWSRPGGGMFLWLTLPGNVDAAVLLERAIDDADVAFVPGAAFFPDRSARNTLRLSFSLNPPAEIEAGISRLAQVISELLVEGPVPDAALGVDKGHVLSLAEVELGGDGARAG
ncbi:MAG: PLP-dependent aminotransferase family protein [Geminicoccaceae bacterium]